MAAAAHAGGIGGDRALPQVPDGAVLRPHRRDGHRVREDQAEHGGVALCRDKVSSAASEGGAVLAINFDKTIVGREACEIVKSIVTGEPRVIRRRITGYMVERDGKVTVRFEDGAWIEERYLYWPSDVGAAYDRFVQQYQK